MEDLPHSLYNTPLHGVQFVDGSQPAEAEHSNNVPFTLDLNVSYTGYTKPTNQAIWTLKDEGERYTSVMELFNTKNGVLFNIECEGSGSFTIEANTIQVNWQPNGTGFEHYIQSVGIACWLELNHIPCIHANAVYYNNNAYLIIAPSRTGKSTLTTHLLTLGFKLMTDDMAAIHTLPNNQVVIYPSWPKIRLWPDVAESIINPVGPEIELDIAVHSNENQNMTERSVKNNLNKQGTLGADVLSDKFASSSSKPVHQKFAKYEINVDTSSNQIWHHCPAPLKGIYYLNRSEDTTQLCQIQQYGPSHSLMVLLQNSILANAYTSMGVESKRLNNLADMLKTTPVFEVEYKSGLNYLPRVNKAIQQHISELL